MAPRPKKKNSWLVLLIITAAVALWVVDQRNGLREEQTESPRKERIPDQHRPPVPGSSSHTPPAKNEQRGRYQVIRNCTHASDRGNDGDSFRVLLPDGRREIFRLYFVDAPESDFKTYRNGENNHDRIRDQAAYFGISAEEAVALGKDGKRFVLDLLGKEPFTLYTEWDSPFRDQRYHAFVEVTQAGKPRWLHELLVQKGLARLKTKPADLPDGSKADSHRRHLETLQANARKSGVGGWSKKSSATR